MNGIVIYASSGKLITLNVCVTMEPDEFGLFKSTYTCHPSLDLQCEHIEDFLQRLPGGTHGIDSDPTIHNLNQRHLT